MFATAGRPDPVPAVVVAAPFVAMAVGKTKEGESFPAKLEYVQYIKETSFSVIAGSMFVPEFCEG